MSSLTVEKGRLRRGQARDELVAPLLPVDLYHLDLVQDVHPVLLHPRRLLLFGNLPFILDVQ